MKTVEAVPDGYEFAGVRSIEEMDSEYVHGVLDRLEYESPVGLNVTDAESMRIATSQMARSNNLRQDLRKYPHLAVLLDRSFFTEAGLGAHMITGDQSTYDVLSQDSRVNGALKRIKESGGDPADKENQLLFTMWSVFFETYPRIARQRSVA